MNKDQRQLIINGMCQELQYEIAQTCIDFISRQRVALMPDEIFGIISMAPIGAAWNVQLETYKGSPVAIDAIKANFMAGVKMFVHTYDMEGKPS